MTKKDLIALRDSIEDEAIKRAIRYAVTRIDVLEERLREVHVLSRAMQRSASFKEEE